MKTLDSLNEYEQEQLFTLIADCMEQMDNGERIDRRKVMWQHPEFAEVLEDYFESSDLVDQMAGPTLAESIANSPTHSGAMQDTTPPGGRKSSVRRQTLPNEFGRYRIIRKLGEGAMGAVYLAFDNQLEREVALKTPSFANDATGELLERFYREAKSAGLLRHPGICPVHDVGNIDGIHYISMAYIDGRTLSSDVEGEKPQDERAIALLIRKLALALDEAHRKGVTHRDLKPANIMIDHRNEPVVMDFGLAYQAGISDELCLTAAAGEEDFEPARQTRPKTILGSPAYMSPEQVESRLDDIGPATDIYCLGVVMYELLTGKLPFDGALVTVLAQIIAVDPDAPSMHRPGLDSRLEAICLKMMSKRIEDRYESMGEVAKEIARVLRKSSSTDTQTTVQQRSPADSKVVNTAGSQLGPFAVRRRAAGVLVASVVASLLILGGVVFLLQSRDATVRLEIKDPRIKVSIAGDTHADDATITLKPGSIPLFVNYAGIDYPTELFTFDRGKNPDLRVSVFENRQIVVRQNGSVIWVKDLPREATSFEPPITPPDSSSTTAAADSTASVAQSVVEQPKSDSPKEGAPRDAVSKPGTDVDPRLVGLAVKSLLDAGKRAIQPREVELPTDIVKALPTVGMKAQEFIADEFKRGLVSILGRRQKQQAGSEPTPRNPAPKSTTSSKAKATTTAPVQPKKIDDALKAADYLTMAKIFLKYDKRYDAEKRVRLAVDIYDDCEELLEALIEENDGKQLAEQARDVLALVKEVTAEKSSK